MQLVEQQPPSTFTTQELARLAVYRAAVGAGFYTDWDGSADGTDRRLLTRLLRVRPLSGAERQHLRRLRERVAAGSFVDDGVAPTSVEGKAADA
jgi:hypothetical protein